MSYKTKNIVYAIVSIGIVVWMLFSPYRGVEFIENTPAILNSVNGFLGSINSGFKLGSRDICEFFRFIEYFVLGVLVFGIIKDNPKKRGFWSIIFITFMGALTAKIDIKYNFIGMKVSVLEYITAFSEFCLGSIFYFFVNKFFLKNNKKKRSITKRI